LNEADISTVATFIVWGTIEFVHIRFRNALKVQGQSVDDLPFKAKWYPYGTYAALAANVFLVFFQGKDIAPGYFIRINNMKRLYCIFESF